MSLDLLSATIGAVFGIAAASALLVILTRKALASSNENNAKLREELAAALSSAELQQEAINERNNEIDELKSKIESSAGENTSLKENIARLKADIVNQEDLNNEKLAVFREADHKMREAFKALSADALKNNNQNFLELAKNSLGKYQDLSKEDLNNRQKQISEMIKPVKESLEKVDTRINEVEKSRREAYGAIIKQVESMMSSQKELSKETGNLVKALRTPNVRGRWGEIQLRRVVELAGMLNHCDFTEQVSQNTDEGRLRPDMVVNLPGGKNVIVDAKTPLSAYIDAGEAATDEEKEELFKTHARHVKDHITALSRKTYWDQFNTTPEFVVMFLPGETFFSAALQYDPSLIEFGVEQKIIPASPTTLIALLRAVAYGWQQEKVAENAQAISSLGKELYDRLATVSGHFDSLGKNLNRSVDSYNKAVRSMESRVLTSARKFPELGASSSSEISELAAIESAAAQLQAPELLESKGSQESNEKEE
ncbi:MAG: DNA recombination protein RmuC [Planctomycetota bacterium]|jgi:DNA recombination protein RmuC